MSYYARTGALLVMSAAIALTLSGCIMQGDVSALTASDTTDPTPAAIDTPTGKDLTNGGQCEAGQDAFVSGQGLTVEITGACGSIRIEGTDLDVTVANAQAVTIRGENNSVHGDMWDNLVIQGASLKGHVSTVGAVDISGTKIEFESEVSNSVLITGEDVTATVGDTRSVDITGAKNTVTALEIVDFAVVSGTDNTLNWSHGIKKETASEGKNNKFNRS